MLICRLAIENFKSLKELELEPQDLTLLIGANASGKSNLADCFDFISEVYQHGLEVAVARKGGYENIAHRKASRTKASVRLRIIAEYTPRDQWLPEPLLGALAKSKMKVEHSFSFVTKGAAIGAEFEVESELLILSLLQGEAEKDLVQLVRDKQSFTYKAISEEDLKKLFPSIDKTVLTLLTQHPQFHYLSTEGAKVITPTELIVPQFGRFTPLLRQFVFEMANIRVFQINPNNARQFGVPTPTPELGRSGENLPTVIDALKKRNAALWQKIFQSMKRILPTLENIDVTYTTSRTLGLFFHERGIGRPWTVDEISDGTLQTLCLLTAIFAQSSRMVVLEEMENSIHPWIIRSLLDACSEAAKEKQIFITTHSPVVIDHTPPDKVWVMWRTDGESHVDRLTKLDPKFMLLWEKGDIATFDLVDSGAISQTIPPRSPEPEAKEKE